MERHVRGHLGRREPLPGEERDMEEEFYYTEIELDVNILNQVNSITKTKNFETTN